MKAILERFDSGMHFVMLDIETMVFFEEKGSKRAISIIGEQRFHCAFMPKKEGGFFVNIGSKICNALGLKLGHELEISFEEDTTEYQFEMPEEFQAVLDQDPDAQAIFISLTDGNKRGLIYLLSLVKSQDKKIERALRIAEKLKAGVHSPRLVMK